MRLYRSWFDDRTAITRSETLDEWIPPDVVFGEGAEVRNEGRCPARPDLRRTHAGALCH